MKTSDEIWKAHLLAQMRCYAMSFREAIHPNTYEPKLSERVRRAVHYVQLAIDYRRMVRKS
jgi:hypothetical protein